MAMNNAPFIGLDQHVFIPGATGSGKTVLAEVYLAGYDNVIKLDTKDEVGERRRKNEPLWRGLTEGEDFVVVETLADLQTAPTNKVIYCPDFREQEPAYYDALFKYVYDRQNTIIWIDELMSITEGPRTDKIPYLKALYTRGRSRQSVVWALTQRPMDIPTICIANSQHYFVFDLPLPQDRKKLYEVSGCESLLDMPGKYNFWYYKLGAQKAQLAKLKL